MGANDSLGGTFSDPRGIIGRIYVKLHITMLHTKYRNFERRSLFFMHFPILSLWQIMAAQGRPMLTPRTLLEGLIKRGTMHCYTQNMMALGLWVSEIFFVFPHCKSM